MDDSTNVFVTERNVDIYLSRAFETNDLQERDTLLRLLVEEQSRMGARREHLENGRRRVDQCSRLLQRQREIVGSFNARERDALQAQFVLETMERTLTLVQDHLQGLERRFHQALL